MRKRRSSTRGTSRGAFGFAKLPTSMSARRCSVLIRNTPSDARKSLPLPRAIGFRQMHQSGFLRCRRLMSYAADFAEMERHAEPLIFRCCSRQKFEMVLNLKAAKALGLVIPTAVLALADDSRIRSAAVGCWHKASGGAVQSMSGVEDKADLPVERLDFSVCEGFRMPAP
jgi:hypothetical protein